MAFPVRQFTIHLLILVPLGLGDADGGTSCPADVGLIQTNVRLDHIVGAARKSQSPTLQGEEPESAPFAGREAATSKSDSVGDARLRPPPLTGPQATASTLERNASNAQITGNWMAGPFGRCTKGCDPPLKQRTVDCKFMFGDAVGTPICGTDAPASVVPCWCDVVQCATEPLANCDPNVSLSSTPHLLPIAQLESLYAFVGCFNLAPGDDVVPGVRPDVMDTTCLHRATGPHKCRSGFPFFRNITAHTPELCSRFCLGKGMDVFGLVSKRECRCGVSMANSAVWKAHRDRRDLVFDPDSLVGAQECPLEVFRYTGYYDSGGIPSSLLQTNLQTTAYIANIVSEAVRYPMHLEDVPEGKSLSKGDQNSEFPAWQRACYPQSCGPGRGPWQERRASGPTQDPNFVDQFESYTWVPYYFGPSIMSDSVDGPVRRETFEKAAQEWYRKTCIVFYEVDQPPSTGVTVDLVDPDACYVTGVGRGSTTLNMGWCKDMESLGNIIHEIGHTLGMLHEQQRPDAAQAYHGHGPFLVVHWDNIPGQWHSQYSADLSYEGANYVGSNNQGPGDPFEGYAPYDFGSIMHYSGEVTFGDSFDTIPHVMEGITGQRSMLSHGDVMQAWDLYQCQLKEGYTKAPTPAPAADMHNVVISGACSQTGFDMNGVYEWRGTTASGASWYKKYGGLHLYFEPLCDGASEKPMWVLDNRNPDLEAPHDLDNNGNCQYWASTQTSSLQYPRTASWRIYCPEVQTFVTIQLELQEEVVTPVPTALATPEPTKMQCVGDAASWSAGFGGCSSYQQGEDNNAFCATDSDSDNDLKAQQVCEECGVCGSPSASPTAIPTESPTASPTKRPTASPTSTPTDSPSASPTLGPTASPTDSPSSSPTESPTASPTKRPTASPTSTPTDSPSASPTESPTASPTNSPSSSPTESPTGSPSAGPTESPTASSTDSPSTTPTESPTASSTDSSNPTTSPTGSPTASSSVGSIGGAPPPSPIEPSPAPTPLPPYSTSSGSQVKATGDPHMINVFGQRFDILHPGSYMLIGIPRLPTREHAEHALLVVDANVRQFGGACSEMYIETLNISGKWVDESTRVNDAAGTGRTILQYRAGEMEKRKATSWRQFGGVGVKVGGGRTQQGVDYLNFFVRHLGRVGHSVGGLLGEDDHMAVAKPSASCIKVTILDVPGTANGNLQTAASAVAAPADAEGAPPGSVAEVMLE